MPDFKLPDLGEGVTEAEIDRWLVEEGDTIDEDDPLVEVITDKATAEIPSPYAGVVAKIHARAGDRVPVGTVLVSIGEEEAGPEADGGAVRFGDGRPGRRPSSGTPNAPSPRVGARPSGNVGASSIKAMPPVRKLARELGVDLAAIAGSGPDGRILRTDVETAAGTGQATATGAPVSRGAPQGGRREPLRGVRRAIAENMTRAHLAIPPVTHVEECDVTELDATRLLIGERNPEGPKITFLPFIVKAVVSALADHPALNSSLEDESNEIVFHDRYDIGVAVDTPAGLTVPVVRDADRKTLMELAEEIGRLADGARRGSLSVDELRGGTFTVTSPGAFGGLMATPIVLHPQAGILGVHRATERPVVRDGQIVIRKMMNVSVTFDHRILDGMTAARFCMEVVRLLEHPAALAF